MRRETWAGSRGREFGYGESGGLGRLVVVERPSDTKLSAFWCSVMHLLVRTAEATRASPRTSLQRDWCVCAVAYAAAQSRNVRGPSGVSAATHAAILFFVRFPSLGGECAPARCTTRAIVDMVAVATLAGQGMTLEMDPTLLRHGGAVIEAGRPHPDSLTAGCCLIRVRELPNIVGRRGDVQRRHVSSTATLASRAAMPPSRWRSRRARASRLRPASESRGPRRMINTPASL
jgi:hypothetical protein